MDLMLLGEGEEMVPELCDLVIKAREEGWSRSRLIEEARQHSRRLCAVAVHA